VRRIWVLQRTGLVLWAAFSCPAWGDPAEEYLGEIRPLIEKHCFECHGPEQQKADLNLSLFADFASVTAALETWHLVLERVQAFEMPPKKAGELRYGDQQKLVKWLRDLPRPEDVDCNTLPSDRTARFYRGYVMSRRLNRAEYLNTLRDLFGVEFPIGDLLPADGGGGEGFDTSGNALFLSPIHVERYLLAAEKALAMVLPDDSHEMDPLLREARRRLLIARPSRASPPRQAARMVVSAFARRAFRRPVTHAEVDRFLTLFDRAWQRGDHYVAALRLALQGVLISPHFLFLAEPEPDLGGVHPLGAFPLATKLSYFLWSSMPDERLLQLAGSGALLDTNIYRAEIRRMLKDPKAGALGERFALQWLDLERLGNEVRPDPSRFPEFDEELAATMRGEVSGYFNHVFRNDRSILELIDSDYTLVNERLAALYAIEGVEGSALRITPVHDRSRGGLLGMAAVHALTSYPLRTSPVLRGRWVLESLLGDKVPPPPPDVPALEEVSVADPASLREQLELHRSKSECAACHDRMDPLGFGLENFDVLGRWRETDQAGPIDARGTLPSGETYEGPDGLKEVLMDRKDKILRHLARKMTGFALGRELNKLDECVIDAAMEALEAHGYRATALVESIALSFPFRHRFHPKQDSDP
jgi:hypothetical protein